MMMEVLQRRLRICVLACAFVFMSAAANAEVANGGMIVSDEITIKIDMECIKAKAN